MLRSTWCTSELVKAVEKDYILHKIHEVWHFPEAQRWTGLFVDYVNTRLKIKKESAGWPSWCQTVDQKWEYILRYQEREGIHLDVSQMVKNPGRKAKAKLVLNRYPFYVLFSCCHSTPSHHFFSFLEFSGANLATGLTSPPPSRSKIPPICSVYYPMRPLTSVPSDCALTTSWKPRIPVCMTMRSKALRPMSLWHPSPLVPLG